MSWTNQPDTPVGRTTQLRELNSRESRASWWDSSTYYLAEKGILALPRIDQHNRYRQESFLACTSRRKCALKIGRFETIPLLFLLVSSIAVCCTRELIRGSAAHEPAHLLRAVGYAADRKSAQQIWYPTSFFDAGEVFRVR